MLLFQPLVQAHLVVQAGLCNREDLDLPIKIKTCLRDVSVQTASTLSPLGPLSPGCPGGP